MSIHHENTGKNYWPNEKRVTMKEIEELIAELRSLSGQLLEPTRSKSTFSKAADLIEQYAKENIEPPCPKCGGNNFTPRQVCSDCGTSWSLGWSLNSKQSNYVERHKLEAVEKSCAAKNAALSMVWDCCCELGGKGLDTLDADMIYKALSTDCGSNYIRKDQNDIIHSENYKEGVFDTADQNQTANPKKPNRPSFEVVESAAKELYESVYTLKWDDVQPQYLRDFWKAIARVLIKEYTRKDGPEVTALVEALEKISRECKVSSYAKLIADKALEQYRNRNCK